MTDGDADGDAGSSGRPPGENGARTTPARAETGTTRRRLLASGSLALLSGLAGCAGGGGGDDLADSAAVFGYPFPHPAGTVQLNPWAGGYPWDVDSILFETQSVRLPDGTRRPADLLEGVEVDGGTVTVRYSEGYSWWNGEPVTARDQWVADRIQSFVAETGRDGRDGASRSASGEHGDGDGDGDDRSPGNGRFDPTLVDEYTLVYDLERPLDRPLALARVVNHTHNTPAWLFEDWLERLTDAADAREREAIVERLRGWTISLSDAMEQGAGSGPYELVEVSPNRLLLERVDDHPRADDLEIDRLWLPIALEGKTDELLGRGEIDGGGGLVEHRRTNPPDHVEQLASYPVASGTKLVLNWRNDHLARRDVRRAIASLLPIDEIASAARWGEPATVQTGLARPAERRWLEESTRERLHRYPVGPDVERAAEYMRSAGYERGRGDRWRDGDGRRVELRVRTPMWDDWLVAADLLEDALESFGFVLEVKRIPSVATIAVAETGNFDLLTWWSGGDPYHAYDVTGTALSSLGYGVDDSDAETGQYGKPVEPAVPTTPGDVDADADGRTPVNLVDQWRRVRRPSSTEVTREAVATVARWWNDALPDIDLATRTTGVWGNTRDFSWPEEDDPAYRVAGPDGRPVSRMVKAGAIRPARDEE